jgi:hypothetical protein
VFDEAVSQAQTFTYPIPAGSKAEDLIAKAREAGRGKGIVLVGDEKRGAFKGTADGTYEVVGNDLVITVTKKPGFVPWGMIETALKGLFTPK